MVFDSVEQLLEVTEGIVGKSFGEIDKLNLLDTSLSDKGILGKVVETGFYGYPLNTRSEADFKNIGVELKVSCFTTLKNGRWSAKERISLSQINYKKIIKEEFDFSSVVTKNSKLLLIWYEHIPGVHKKDLIIRTFQLYDLAKVDSIIRNDYKLIQNKVKKGLAHKLSEGDSVILGAATKGQAGQTQEQPKSKIDAPTRAFSLKNSFLRGVLREHQEKCTSQLTPELTPEEWVWNKIKGYKGIPQLEILKRIDPRYCIDKIPKCLNAMLINRIIGNKKELEKNEIFNKSTYEIKNIPINSHFYPLEKATFHTLNIQDFKDSWEVSKWKTFFEESTFIYIGYLGNDNLYRNIPNGQRPLHCLFKVTFTNEEVQSFGVTYNLIKQAVEQNDITKLPTATLYPDIPLVISTKAAKGNAYEAFFNGKSTTCFMFNKDFMKKKFSEAKIFL